MSQSGRSLDLASLSELGFCPNGHDAGPQIATFIDKNEKVQQGPVGTHEPKARDLESPGIAAPSTAAEERRSGSLHGWLLDLQARAGNRAVAQLLAHDSSGLAVQRQPTGPTFGNLMPEDVFNPKITTFKLEFVGGDWWEVRPPGSGKQRRLAKGTYNYVVKGDVIHAHRTWGHVQLGRGERVSFAGEIHFLEPGKLDTWTNASGHTRASKTFVQGDRMRLARLGLEEAKFVPLPPGGKPGPQLAVWPQGVEPTPLPGQEAKGGSAEIKAAAAEVEGAAGGAKGVATEAKLIGAEATGAMKAENVLTKGAQLAAKGAKLARISQLAIALGMPGPQDVLFMFIAAFASMAEAKAKLRASGFATGFAQGIAAVITWTDPEKAARMLAYKVADPEMGERVAGFEGTREKGTNDGLQAGWKFGSALNGEQRKGFRGTALDATGIRLKRHYNRDELIEIGGVLRPTVVALLAEAARQEQEKEDKAKAEAYARGIAARRR